MGDDSIMITDHLGSARSKSGSRTRASATTRTHRSDQSQPPHSLYITTETRGRTHLKPASDDDDAGEGEGKRHKIRFDKMRYYIFILRHHSLSAIESSARSTVAHIEHSFRISNFEYRPKSEMKGTFATFSQCCGFSTKECEVGACWCAGAKGRGYPSQTITRLNLAWFRVKRNAD